jgi:DNA-binding MarR family transcriptional regulator
MSGRGGLQAELKQRKPFKSLEEEVHLNVLRTAAVIDHALQQALKPCGITPTQYNVLRILRGAQPDGLCRNEVGERLVTSVPDVTRLLDRMEEMDLIARRRSSADRRYVTTTITKKGLAVLDQADPEIAIVNRQLLGHVDRKRLRVLARLLTEVRARE